ncbi:MAG: winged helix-turn-helix domain-containing protein, partial [Candidatus Jordarchaeaceae archaeon]
TKHGINASFWDRRELRLYFLRRGKTVSQETVRRCLKSMGARYVKAEIEYAEANEDEREKFARQFLQDLASKPDSVVVLFQDKDGCGVLPKKGLWVDFREKAGGKPPRPTGGG